MADTQLPPNIGPQHQGILDQTLGEVLKNNPQAQGMIMQSMHLSPEKFQQMVNMAQGNALMNTKIRDLFSNGTVQQALAQKGQNAQNLQLTPEQISQMQENGQVVIQAQPGQQMPQSSQPQPSFMQKLKGMLGF